MAPRCAVISRIKHPIPRALSDSLPGDCVAAGGLQLTGGLRGGAALQVVGKSEGYVNVKLPSGELRKVLENCRASVGILSNVDKKNQKLGKAGRNRWLGKRPSVRGVAMNPIDHPHGGGEGKTSGGRHPVTPWGKPTKGKKTRSNKRTDKYIIKRKTDKKARIEV